MWLWDEAFVEEKGGGNGEGGGRPHCMRPAVLRCLACYVCCGWDLHFHGLQGHGEAGEFFIVLVA